MKKGRCICVQCICVQEADLGFLQVVERSPMDDFDSTVGDSTVGPLKITDRGIKVVHRRSLDDL